MAVVIGLFGVAAGLLSQQHCTPGLVLLAVLGDQAVTASMPTNTAAK